MNIKKLIVILIPSTTLIKKTNEIVRKKIESWNSCIILDTIKYNAVIENRINSITVNIFFLPL